MPQHSVTLESPWKRIKLVPPSSLDDQEAASCRTHPTTRRYLRFLPEHMTEDEARVRRETRAEDPRVFDLIIYLNQENGMTRFAGFTGYFNLDENHSSCEVGIIVSPDLHGKNIATETLYLMLRYIFEEKGLHRATLRTGSDNIGMQGWLKKTAGARLESEEKECWKQPDGTFQDVRGYAILDWEWRDNVKARLEGRMGRLP
ncbi:hypothetical protein NLJ89_g2438 [Agrocybe chaxingu]|uniref:N-acetyltransferase domain-containing protein n=1 Tax=Agrocybe chaxingu TaxID=84603 RepID=A0A9W8K4E3_9AGAR|nr:hypothetical protein NLJ89_g2438 [Agrocybe chaxingu]